MEVTEGRMGGVTTLRIVGRVDSSVSKLLEQKVAEVASRDDAIVVDLRDMNYVSSAGLRSFIILAKHARSQQSDHRVVRDARRGHGDFRDQRPCSNCSPSTTAWKLPSPRCRE